jgi:N-acyl-L-homoserine lactone synthetase
MLRRDHGLVKAHRCPCHILQKTQAIPIVGGQRLLKKQRPEILSGKS